MHRQLLIQRLKVLGGPENVTNAHVASLRCSSESFAQWRWKTLHRVTTHLARMQAAVIVATGGLSASQLASRDSGLVAVFLETVGQPAFWQRVSFLGQLVGPLMEFSSWIRGCDCHEQARMLGSRVTCDWAGCRAPRLANRMGQAMGAIDQLRRQNDPAMASAASAVLASMDQKMSWVNSTPYTIWQAI